MFNNNKILAIIPARGGSKGLPGKNIKSLCDKPLVSWSIQQALHSQFIDNVLVSTDSNIIQNIALQSGAECPFLRPDALSNDFASTYDVVEHAIDYYLKFYDKNFDYILLLEPTSPLREDTDIDQAISMLGNNEDCFDSVVSIGKVEHHPSIMKVLDGQRIIPFDSGLKSCTRRQENDDVYFPFGVLYLVKTSNLLCEKTFYTERCMGMKIKRYQCYEIDDIYDFICVEAVMKYERGIR